MHFLKAIMLPLCLLLFRITTAQLLTLPGYTTQTFGAANGLLSSEVICLYQDARDFIWIGTRDGISRYDGRQFQNFEYIHNNRIGVVYSITEDKEATLWISTETGLYYWDGKTFIQRNFKNQTAWLPFAAIHFTGTGDVWLGTKKGPVHLPHLQKSGGYELDHYLLQGWDTIARHDGSVTAIHSSGKGVVFGAYVSVYLYQDYQLRKLPNVYSPREYLRDVFIDEAGIVYWNNVITGFHYWDGKQIIKPVTATGFFFDIFSKVNRMYLYSNAGIIEVQQDHTTKLLVNLEALTMRSPSCMLLDKEGAWWLGAAEGLFRIKKNEFITHHNGKLMYADDMYAMLRRRNGDLLLGANRGSIFTVKNSLQSYANGLQVVPLAEVFSMYEDEDQSLWFGTGYQGIALYKNGRLKNFTTKNGLPDNSHYAFYKSKKGALWSAGDMGITRIEKITIDSFRFQPFFYSLEPWFHKVYGIAEAPDSSIWAGGQLGLFYLRNDSLLPYRLPELTAQKIFITAIKQNNDKEVWLTTRGHGILRCIFDTDNKLHLAQQWREQDGLAANTYLSLAFDENNNVWAGGYSGVTALQNGPGNLFSIKNFDVRDGFISKNYQSLNMFADGATIWACTSSGAVSFQPASLLTQSRQAKLYITSIELLNSKSTAEEFLTTNGNNPEKSFLFPHYIHSFSVQFAALYYTNTEAIRYYYQLQMADSQWISTGTERAIRFRQLQPGKYKLLIKASIGGSDWTNTAVLNFEIKKPWWLQWWVIATTALLTAFSIFLYAATRERNLRQKEQQKTAFEKFKANSYQHQLEIEQVINYFATSLNGHTSIEGVLWDVARNCIARLGFDDCVIYLKNDAGNVLVQKAAWGPKTTEENRIVDPIEIPVGKGIVGAVAVTGKAEKIDDASTDSRYIVDDEQRLSEIAVPIFEDENVIGVIDSEHNEKNFYTGRHLQILTTIASHCGARIGMIKAEAKASAARIEALLNKQKALEASLQSMRLQMNPHFLFNALNAIQRMILAGNETTATRFLSKFSRLLRMVLVNSDKEEVSLKEELELMHLYIELESLRFEDSFSYSIDCEESIDSEEIFVPTLFFQPLVENAIWHGLLHKSGERFLRVQFAECNDACLLCTIEDNGIGRQAAAQNRNMQEHTGKGLSVATQRIQTLNEMNGTSNSLQIIDLRDEKGSATGTRIEIIFYHQ